MPVIVPEIARTGNELTVQEGDDLTEGVKKTLKDFLRSAQTDPDTGNKYLDDSTFTTDEVLDQQKQGQFYRLLPPDEFGDVQDIINTTLDTNVTAADILSAIEGVPANIDGVIPPEPVQEADPNANTIIRATSEVLRTNRFSPGNHYFQDGNIPNQFATMPRGFGTSEPGAPAEFSELQKVGLSLMLRATGEFIEGDPTSPGISLASLLPGQAQLGVRIDGNTLRAEDVPGAPGVGQGARGRRSRLRDIIGSGQASYGQLNSCNEPFDGFLPLGMTGLAIILIIALRLATTALLGIFSLIGASKPSRKANKPAVDTLQFGEYGRQRNQGGALISLTDIGIIHLDRDFIEASNEGINVFFGFDGSSFRRVVRSPGFYANMVRIIIQSGARVIRSIVDAFKKIAGGNIVAGAQALLGLVDILSTSKIIAFLNIIAQIGDRALTAKERGITSAPRQSLVDAIAVNPTTRISKSRDQSAGNSLAWRQSSAPAVLNLPRSMFIAGAHLNRSNQVTMIGSAHGDLLGNDLQNLRQSIFETPRLGADIVEQVETVLDSEYVPFYFHDLRTNEFVSFHAFIDNVNESFAPNYNTMQPYGRVDPVMTYVNTTRTFNVSYYVVATSPRDFDLMWVKLNKLTTLVYPQWTKGRLITDEEGRQFRQPFSQIPGASPLVRLRLGDLFRTNFSSLALARLFGADETTFLSTNSEDGGDTAKPAAELIRIKQEIQDNGWQPQQIARLDTSSIKNVIKSGGAGLIPIPFSKSDDSDAKRAAEQMQRSGDIYVDIKEVAEKRNYKGVETNYYIVVPRSSKFSEFELSVPEPLLAVDGVEVNRQLGENPPAESADPTLPTPEGAPGEFFDFGGDGNAIVRSFRNTQGKGVAGFITSMNFDWNEATQNGKWETAAFGGRAPQMLKIDISFTVIHDIPPGLDANGYNRAPIYPTGKFYNNQFSDDAYDSSRSAEAKYNEWRNSGKVNGGK